MTSPQDATWSLWGGKFATTRELLGQIGFLVNQEHELNQELAKYQSYAKYHLPGAKEAIISVQARLDQLNEQEEYYMKMLLDLKAKGQAV